MKEIEELLEDIIESSKVAALRFPRNGIEAQKVLTIKAEIMKRFDELEKFYKHTHKVEYVAGITRPYEQKIAELEAQVAKLKKAIAIRDRIME